ncbi:hypothetical protein OPKNFCMD_2202 [Methylobacterium crusticola]|uniref:Uncharacterized protein n=1 Tax=Methylobacterium crusticola TaxID=1697972 RepID=A0ABQ4QVU9_9HYPH|nr:hypothetical protein [Methylobacterium crusticola]GJD49471.1 hypothetical protein OPKNFCMD_2202 [Methylobacterium crusticola]
MDNVIRPVFRRESKARSVDRPDIVKSYGEVGSYTVSLVRDQLDEHGDVYKVVIGSAGGSSVGSVGIEPATPDGLFDSNLIGMAVLRTLELLENRSGDFDVA